MDPLWDGLIGAVIGGVLAASATFTTVYWQTRKLLQDERDRAREARDEEHRDWLRRREEQALAGLLVALSELQLHVPQMYALHPYRMARTQSDDHYEAKRVYDLIAHGLRVDLPVISDPEVRRRYAELVSLVEELARLGLGQTADQRDRWRGDAIRYIGYVRFTVKRALHSTVLPARADPPVLQRSDEALWTPPEMDPEDAYFPELESNDGSA